MTPQIGDVYYHYKYFTEKNLNHVYEIIGIAGNAHDNNYEDKWVVYKNIVDKTFTDSLGITCYIRPLNEFLEEVSVGEGMMSRFIKKTDG